MISSEIFKRLVSFTFAVILFASPAYHVLAQSDGGVAPPPGEPTSSTAIEPAALQAATTSEIAVPPARATTTPPAPTSPSTPKPTPAPASPPQVPSVPTPAPAIAAPISSPSVPTSSNEETNNDDGGMTMALLAALAAALGAGALFAGARALFRRNAKPDNAQKKEHGQRCFDIKKLVEEKLKELTDLRGQLEDKAQEAAREKIQEAAQGTSAEELLVRIAQGETAYKRLKQLYEKCVIEFGTKERVLVIGASLSGKAALVEYFRSKKYNSPVEEMEEQLAQKNDGVLPTENAERHRFVSEIVGDVLDQKKILFFTNTEYLTTDDLRAARKKGFAIIQLSLESAELQRRNELVDKVVDANQATEDIAAELVKFLE